MDGKVSRIENNTVVQSLSPEILEYFKNFDIVFGHNVISFPKGDIITKLDITGCQVQASMDRVEEGIVDLDIIYPGGKKIELEIISGIPQIR